MIKLVNFLEKLLIATLTIGVIYLLMITDTSAIALADMMEGM